MHAIRRTLFLTELRSFKLSIRNARSLAKIPRDGKLKTVLHPTPQFSNGGAGKLLRATGFCLAVSGTAFVGCAIWNYEAVRRKLKGKLATLLPGGLKHGKWRGQAQVYWNDLNGGKKLIIALIAANCVVFLLWQLRSLQPFMSKYFLSDPNAKRLGLPLLFSMFSHIAPFHLFCNMYVLWSFSDASIHMFGSEQFLFFYLSAGLFSGLMSLTNKLVRGIPQPSLGASGAIIGALAAVCTAFPDSKLSIIFLPMYPFSADSALKFLMAFESLGVLMKWRFFDHAAHLGGILFGIWYVKYGHKLLWGHRQTIVEPWHKFRGSDSPRR